MNTHPPTQAVRNHKTCCFLSCSDDNLLPARGKRFSQLIRKLIRRRGGVSSVGFWGFRQKYQRENSQLKTCFWWKPTPNFLQLLFFYISASVQQWVALSSHSERDLDLISVTSVWGLNPVTCISMPWGFSDQRHAKWLGMQTELPIWKMLRRHAEIAGNTAVQNELTYGPKKQANKWF